jgi:methyl-accepting chemotaxis protein
MIDTTSQAMDDSVQVSNAALEDSTKMVKEIDWIISKIMEINTHSTSNQESVDKIIQDSQRLKEVAVSLEKRIGEFKS